MFLREFTTRPGNIPQSQPLDESQVANNAGGFVYQIDPWAQLDRFLILGTAGGTYYVGERELTKENAKHILGLLAIDGLRVVNRIVEISEAGRAPKQDYGIFALAMAAGFAGDTPNAVGTRSQALAAMFRVCRTGSTLLQFASYVEQFRGWGRGLRCAIGEWYNEKSLDQVTYQVTKYANRHGWTHRDLLRLAHPIPIDSARGVLFRHIVGKEVSTSELPEMAQLALEAKMTVDISQERKIELARKLPHEAIPTEWKREAAVWEALLLGGMPLTAIVRNLGKMTNVGILNPGSPGSDYITKSLLDEGYIRASRLHPAAILVALKRYAAGKGDKGTLTWIPNPQIVGALDAAFSLAFANVEPCLKRIKIGLDVSGSMSAPISGIPGLEAREATAAMSMIQVATEPHVDVWAFTSAADYRVGRGALGRTSGMKRVPVAKGHTVRDLIGYTRDLPHGGTDCSLPILHAIAEKETVELFVIYTDSETWAGEKHAMQALREYRQASGINAKLVVVGTTASGFSIADPTDPGSLDVVGFDSATPAVIADFAR